LINQTYESDKKSDGTRTQWQRFNKYLKYLNSKAPKHVEYKLLFIGRHGEGYHNAAQTYYGTPAWNVSFSQRSIYPKTQLTNPSATGSNKPATAPYPGKMPI